MKIGIISDTHIKKNHDRIDKFLSEHLNDVDIVIHLGDFTDKKTLDKFMEFDNFVGVYGNVDSGEVRDTLLEEEIIEVEGYKIGIFHGHGVKKDTVERAYDRFKDRQVDVIAFGHSHQPLIRTMNKVLLLNPGSPTDKRREKNFSYIVLELEEGIMNAQIRFFS